MISAIKEARNQEKAKKKENFTKAIVAAIKNGSYEFTYGYNSQEDFQEIEEVIADLNKELEEDKFVLKIKSKMNRPATYSIYIEGRYIGSFLNTIQVSIDAL